MIQTTTTSGIDLQTAQREKFRTLDAAFEDYDVATGRHYADRLPGDRVGIDVARKFVVVETTIAGKQFTQRVVHHG
jgi:hypothetical protein